MEKDTKFEKRLRFVTKHYRENSLDTEKAWQQFASDRKISKRFVLPRYLLAAASVILLLLIARIGYVYMAGADEWVVIASEAGQRKEVFLPDSSRLFMAGGSSIRYNKKTFGEKRRDVEMSGKVFYQVSKDESRPFSVKTLSTVVTVLGTGFQVNEQAGATTVYVESGKVNLAPVDEDPRVILTAGMTAVYETEAGVIHVDVDENTNITAWKTRQLRFDNTPLNQVLLDLEDFYQMGIRNQTPTQTGVALKLTATFNDLPIEDVLQVINHTLDVHLVAN